MRAAACALAFAASIFVARDVSADCASLDPAAVNAAKEGDELKTSNVDAAIAKYRHAHELAPTSHHILWKLALAYQKKESWADVERTLADAITLAPKHANYVMLRGIALARLKRWSDARAVLQRAVTLDPNLADAHYELAEAALRDGDEKTALVEYTKAIQAAPDDVTLYGPLAELYIRLAFDDHAERTLAAGEAVPTDDRKKFALYSMHGDVLERRGNLPGAVAKYEQAKKSCGNCNEGVEPLAFFNLGMAYASLKPPRKSEAMAQLQTFQKMVCKGAAAQKYADQCAQVQAIAAKLGGALY